NRVGDLFVQARAERNEERHEVIDGRVRVPHAGSSGAVIEQCVDVALRERLGAPGIELRGPRWRRRVGTELTTARQAARREAAAHDEDAFVAERRELAAEIEQL